MKRICYVFMRFPAPSEAFAAEEIKAIVRAGADVSVACMRGPTRETKRLISERDLTELEISHGGMGGFWRGLVEIGRRPRAALRVFKKVVAGTRSSPKEFLISSIFLPRAFEIAKKVRLTEIDAVHLFWGHYPSLVAVAMREMQLDTGITISLGAYDLVREYPITKLAARSSSIITHAEANRGEVARVCGVNEKNINVVYRGVTVPPDPGHPSRENRIIVAERLVEQKKTIDALKAFKKLALENSFAQLEVLGDGPERAKLEAWIKKEGLGERVKFFGHLPHEEAMSRMESAGILLSMSQSPGERLPNVVKEAMVRRCACIVTRTPGIEELVIPSETGCIVNPGAVEEAAWWLGELLSDTDLLERVGKSGRNHIKNIFDLDITTKKRMGIWGSLNDEGRS